MIRRVREGAITWFTDLKLADIPYSLPSGISLHSRQGEMGIEVQGLVGAIPLLNGDTLQIIPKIGQVNFLRLLFKAEGYQSELEKAYDDFVEYAVEDEESIDSIVARQLMLSASEILGRSPKTGRIKRRREGVFAVGQMDATATALNIASRKREPITYFSRDKTLEIPENRVMTEAVLKAFAALDPDEQSSFRAVYNKWTSRFPRAKDLNADLLHVERGFAAAKYGGPRDYYKKALMLSQIVLGSSGLGFDEAAVVCGDAILLNTAYIFEKYLRNVISEAYSVSGHVVTKGGTVFSSLYTDGSFEIEPDIVISKNERTVLISDAKYKEPSSSDHYQMHSYLVVNNVKRGLLLSPLYAGHEIVIREFSTADKIVIKEVYLPMSDLPATEKFLGTILEQLS